MSLGVAVPLLDGADAAGEPALAWVRGLTGADELLVDEAELDFPAARTTRLLARVTARIGERAPVTADDVRGLTIGDRERLLLGCAMSTFGAALDTVVRCPHDDCGELAELSVDLAELLKPAHAPHRPREHCLAIPGADGSHALRFRLPTGADQEAVAKQARDDPRRGAASLLELCLIAPPAAPHGPDDEIAVAEAIAALDPAFEWAAETDCPACGRPVGALLDGLALLTSGAARSSQLYREVDRLARAYHWSEEAILALPVNRRRRYLDLVAAQDSA